MSTITHCAREGCGHPRRAHSPRNGCLADNRTDPARYCDCDSYAIPMPDTVRALAEGRERRDQGAARAGTGSPGALASGWRDDAETALSKLIASGETFSADDLVELAGMPPVPNMLGAVFLAASRQGRIVAVGYRQGTRAASHARVQRVWAAA